MNEPQFLPPEPIGFIGLGNMGGPMARCLAAAGYGLVVADAHAPTLARFSAEVACEQAASPGQLARNCRVVITMLPDSHAVRDVLFGADGLVSALEPGGIVIDMTSGSPLATKEFAAQLTARGLNLIDAPVSGGVPRAVAGTLAVMVGGDPLLISRCRGILAAFGKSFLTGVVGSGHAMKALNNFLSAIALVATGEAMIAGERFGIDPKLMLDVFNASTGRNTATEQKFPAYVLPGSFNSGFALGLMAKDLGLALDLAKACGGPTRLLEDTTALYRAAQQQYGFRADNTDIIRYLESLATMT